jgi:hypothetical protein
MSAPSPASADKYVITKDNYNGPCVIGYRYAE